MPLHLSFTEDFETADWEKFHLYAIELNCQSTPYRDPPDFLSFRDSWTEFTLPIEMKCFILCDGPAIVASGRYWYEAEHSPHYQQNKNIMNSDIWFLESTFQRAYADSIHALIKQVMHRQELSVGQLIMNHGSAYQIFHQEFGLSQVSHLYELGLDRSSIARDVLSRWRQLVPSYAVRKLNWIDELDAIALLYSEAQRDVPTQGARVLMKTFDAAYFVRFHQDLRRKGRQLLGYGLYKGSTLVALNLLTARADDPTQFEVEFTGVKKNLRGQGLGKRIKAEVLTQLLHEFPRLQSILTSTNEVNWAMLKINSQLGFVPMTEYSILHYYSEVLGRA